MNYEQSVSVYKTRGFVLCVLCSMIMVILSGALMP